VPTWRNVLLAHVSAGVLTGITLPDWLTLLRENRFAVAPRYVPRALMIALHGAQNSLLRRREDREYGSRLQHVAVPPPLFILGHWRGGTTHLHNLVATDQRFAFPTTLQAFFPHAFLSTETGTARLMSRFLPTHRPMDNVEWGPRLPQEDEFALCVSSLKSPYVSWVFPRHRHRYDRYLTLRGLSARELEQWREALWLFLRKLTWKYDGRPLILKSPAHTCRIKVLLEMFPQARFVHIHRDPYTVFQSSRKLFRVNFGLSGVQRPGLEDLDDWILRQYRVMYDVFFEERALIPAGRLHEMRFERLEEDPVGEVRRLYEALDLPDFGPAEPALKRYVESIAGYRKNAFPEIPADLRRRIAGEWRRCFVEWGYPA
jgi:hypothetical protein